MKLDISINDVNYERNKCILQAITIEINQPGIYGVFGKNGQGKSTFLKTRGRGSKR